MTRRDPLARYVRAHGVGARTGQELFARSARSQLDPEVRRQLRDLSEEIAADRLALQGILDLLGTRIHPVTERLAVVAERVGRLKPNGSLLRRTRLSDLVELEALSAAVQAKRLGWEALREVAEEDERLDAAQLDCLIDRARDQEDRLDGMRLGVSRELLGHDRGG